MTCQVFFSDLEGWSLKLVLFINYMYFRHMPFLKHEEFTYVNVYMTCQVMWTDSFELGCGFPVISALMRTVYKSKADSGSIQQIHI